MRKLRDRVVARRARVVLVVAIAAAVGGIAGIITVAATGAAHPRPKALAHRATAKTVIDARLAHVLNLRQGHSWRVGVWRDAARVKRSLVLTSSSGGALSADVSSETICLVFDVGAGASALGCNPAGDFFQGRSVVWTKAAVGGPQLASMSHLFVAGIVTSSVSTIDIVDSAGTHHAVQFNDDGAFMFEMPRSDLADGITPVALVTYSSDGALLNRVDL
jgi:hypothetical protein